MAKLTILLLCWNHADYITQCLQALERQTCQDFELILLDNASSDQSLAIANQFLSASSLTAKVLRNEHPLGISRNLNRLFAASTTPYCSVLSTDDWYEPDYVERVLAGFSDYPEAAIIAVNGWYEYVEDRISKTSSAQSHPPRQLGIEFLTDQNFFWVGLSYSRAALEEVGGWDESQSVEDMDLVFRLTRSHHVLQLARPLVHYRKTSEAISSNPVFMTNGRLRFYLKHRNAFGRDWNTHVAEMLRAGAAVCIDQHYYADAMLLLRKSLRYNPISFAGWKTAAYLARAKLFRAR